MLTKKNILKGLSIISVFAISFTATSAWNTNISTKNEITSNVKAGLVCTEENKIDLNIFFKEHLQDQGLINGEWQSGDEHGTITLLAKDNMARLKNIMENEELVSVLYSKKNITFKAHSEDKIYGTQISLKKFSKALRNLKRECK